MGIIRKIKFALALLAGIRDLRKTDKLFQILDNGRFINDEGFAVTINKLEQYPAGRAMLSQSYLADHDLSQLQQLPPNTFGYAYAKHMRDNNLNPVFYPALNIDSRAAYISMRFRQTHDILHVLTGFSTEVPGEAGVLAFTLTQTCGRGGGLLLGVGLIHCALFKPELLYPMISSMAAGYAMGMRAKPMFGEKFEEKWNLDLIQYRRELGLSEAQSFSTDQSSDLSG